MIISYNTAFANFTLHNGFGRAGWGIINALKDMGHTVGFNYHKAPVELTFAQPEYFEPRKGVHQILLVPWESTKLPPRWLTKMHQADEVWATSDWVAQVYRDAGVNNVTNVYPHGIEKRYRPSLKRRVNGPLHILNMGTPANRKGSQEALDAFREAFGDNPNRAVLTIKAYQRNNTRWYDSTGRVRDPKEIRNVRVVRNQFEIDSLVEFTNQFHANVYPTWGEGFGFIPLESLAQATPTITTHDWAQYKDYIHLPIDADQVESPWQWEHPGLMYKPRQESLVEQYLRLEEEYNEQATKHFAQSLDLHNEYSWDRLTKIAFDSVFQRFDDSYTGILT